MTKRSPRLITVVFIFQMSNLEEEAFVSNPQKSAVNLNKIHIFNDRIAMNYEDSELKYDLNKKFNFVR